MMHNEISHDPVQSVFNAVLVFFAADDSILVNDSLELLFNIRPHSPTGLLLYFGNFSRSQNELEKSHYLTVYMLDGEVGLDPM